MNDRYLFKAKQKNWKDLPEEEWWVQGYYVQGFDDDEEPIHIIFDPMTVFEVEGWEVDPSTICQCTALKDKNGNLIFENDIAKDDRGNFYKAFWQDKHYQFSWVCIKSNFFPIGVKWDLWSFKSYEIEFISSIFDNPELLEVE